MSRIGIIPFDVDHVGVLTDFGGQEHLVATISRSDIEFLSNRGLAWSVTRGDGIIACGGFVAANRFRATAWALFSGGIREDFAAIHRAALAGLEAAPYQLIEAYVDPKSFPAMRWIRLLGFSLRRSYLPLFFPDGSGASEWVYQPRGRQT